MNTAPFGTTGFEISRVGIGSFQAAGRGAWGFGPDADDRAAREAIRHAVDNGVTWVDTAASYGLGHSEEQVALALKPWRVGEEVFVFTKCAHPWEPPDRIRTDLSPQSIRQECEGSLRRLGVERIDLYQFHHPDPATPVEASWETMAELVGEGKVRWAGVSNFDIALLERCEPILHVDSLQPELSLVRPEALDVIAWCARNGTGVIPYSPLGSGLLTGVRTEERLARLTESDDTEPGLADRVTDVLACLRMVAGRHDVSPIALAVAWVLGAEGVTGAICGARNPDQVEGWIGAAGVPGEAVEELHACVAGPTVAETSF